MDRTITLVYCFYVLHLNVIKSHHGIAQIINVVGFFVWIMYTICIFSVKVLVVVMWEIIGPNHRRMGDKYFVMNIKLSFRSKHQQKFCQKEPIQHNTRGKNFQNTGNVIIAKSI